MSIISAFRPISVSTRNLVDGDTDLKWDNPFECSFAFYIETNHLNCSINEMTSFCMKCNAGLIWVRINLTLTLEGNMIASSKCHHVSWRSKKASLSWTGLILMKMASLTIDFYEKHMYQKNYLNVFITCMEIYGALQIWLKLQKFHLFYYNKYV